MRLRLLLMLMLMLLLLHLLLLLLRTLFGDTSRRHLDLRALRPSPCTRARACFTMHRQWQYCG